MNIVSWNIRLGLLRGIDEIIRRIKILRPDVLAIQEIGQHWVMGPEGDVPAQIAEACGFDYYDFAPSINLSTPEHRDCLPPSLRGTAGAYGHAIFVRKPYDARRISFLPLPRNIDEPRSLLITSIMDEDENEVIALTTHLSHKEDRESQGEYLLQMVKKRAHERAVIAGDLNEYMLPKPAWLQELSQFATIARNDAPTYPASHPVEIRDYLFCLNGIWENVTVIDTHEASDHLPIIGRLVF